MAKICPGCGFQVDDDHALFCNKCGLPFPQQRPARSVVVKGPVSSPPTRESRAARSPRARPPRRGSGVNAFLSFDSLITGKYLKLIYIIGAVLIVLVSLVGVTGGFAVKGEVPANMSFTNTSAVVQHSGSSPLFWFGFLVLGSLLWRMFCELFASPSLHTESGVLSDEEYPEEEYEEDYAEPGPEEPVRYVTCPKCQKLVTTDQLRACEHCGIQGCVNCIRPMGLLKKTMTCRECFEAK